MTDYAPRSSQNCNLLASSTHLAMPHYSNSNGLSCFVYNGQTPYQAMAGPCPTYPASYLPSHSAPPTPLFMSDHSGFGLHYPGTSMRAPTLPSQSRQLSTRHYFPPPLSRDRSVHPQQLCSMPQEYAQIDHTEDQDSGNSKTMLSEPVHPALEGFPDVHAFDNLMDR